MGGTYSIRRPPALLLRSPFGADLLFQNVAGLVRKIPRRLASISPYLLFDSSPTHKQLSIQAIHWCSIISFKLIVFRPFFNQSNQHPLPFSNRPKSPGTNTPSLIENTMHPLIRLFMSFLLYVSRTAPRSIVQGLRS